MVSAQAKATLGRAERIQRVIGAVYGGERDHQRVVLRMLAKLPKPKPSAAKRTIGAPLATVQKSSEAMLSRQATRRLRIAGDRLTQVVAPLGRVCSEARTRFAAAVKKQSRSQHTAHDHALNTD